MSSGFVAMRQGGKRGPETKRQSGTAGRDLVPTIVFHGSRDNTVHSANADEIIAHVGSGSPLTTRIEEGQAPGGHAYRRTLHADARGDVVLEKWLVHGAGHAWSGGSPMGSFTDPHGPDASTEMLRFFLAHPMPKAR